MAKEMFCPICDQPIKGRYCKHCKEFVTPYEHEVDYHMNESHDPKNDAGCEYHGTAPAQTASSSERMEQAKKSFESNGAVRSTGTAQPVSEGKKKSGVMVSIWIILIGLMCAALAGFMAGMNDHDEPDPVDVDLPVSSAAAVDESVNDDMANPFTQPQGEGYLSDDEYQKLLEENGFDEEGYKDLDYDEVLAAGEPCNGWIHFEGLTSRTASRHIRSALEDADIEASNYNADVETDNYYYMNRYGEIESYYQSYLYVTLDDDSYDLGYSGFLYLVSDSVTDELMAVCVKCDDKDTFVNACEAIMLELDEDDYFDIKTMFKLDINRALTDDDGYEYLEYGALWFDLTYYDEIPDDNYQYTGWIYLGDNGEEE